MRADSAGEKEILGEKQLRRCRGRRPEARRGSCRAGPCLYGRGARGSSALRGTAPRSVSPPGSSRAALGQGHEECEKGLGPRDHSCPFGGAV